MYKLILTLIILLFFFPEGQSQILQSGVPTTIEFSTLKVDGRGINPPGGCPSLQLKGNASEYVTGMPFYWRIDSLIGPAGSVVFDRNPDLSQQVIAVGDTFGLALGSIRMYTTAYPTAIYLTLIASGTPQVTGEQYLCDYRLYFTYIFDGCGSNILQRGSADSYPACVVDSTYLMAQFDVPYECSPDSIDLINTSVGAIDSCLWDFGDGITIWSCDDQTHYYPEGQYFYPQLFVYDSLGYIDSTYALRIRRGLPPVAFFTISDSVISIGDSVEFCIYNTDLQPGYTVYWDFKDGTTSTTDSVGCFYHTFTNVSALDSIWLYVGNPNGCGDRHYVSINMVVGMGNNPDAPSTFLVHPNPTSSQITIEAALPIIQINIYNLNGKRVQTLNGINATVFKFTHERLPPGLYFLEVINEEGILARKRVIIQ